MWQSVQTDPNKFPDSLSEIYEYINGGVNGLNAKKEDGTTTAHSIDENSGKLISKYDDSNEWVYPAH